MLLCWTLNFYNFYRPVLYRSNTLEGYFVVTGARLEKQPEIPWDIRAHSTRPQEKILPNYISYLHAIMTSTECVDSSTCNC